jgi:hypothetical protein
MKTRNHTDSTKEVNVIRVEHLTLKELNNEHAQSEGYHTVEELTNALSKYYTLQPDLPITYLKWEEA